jgi:hypothetical protein
MLNESTMQESQYNQPQQLNNGMGLQLRTVGPPQPPIQKSSLMASNRRTGSIPSSHTNIAIANGPGTIGGTGTAHVGSNMTNQQQSDVALLQILLPGVHITSDTTDSIGLRVGGTPGWGSDPVTLDRPHQGQQIIGNNRAGVIGGGNWNGNDGGNKGMSVLTGTIGPSTYPQQSQQQNLNQGSGIW